MDFNETVFVGKVKSAPSITTGADGKKKASFTLVVNDRAPGASGQWTDRFMDVMCFTHNDVLAAKVIEPHVKDGQELLVKCEYINWMADNALKHAFRITTIKLGYTPRQKKDDAPADSGFPG